MKVFYKTVHHNLGSHYVFLESDPCCEEMKSYADDYIAFSRNTYPKLCLIFQIFEDIEYVDIDFCPWCGEEIFPVEKEKTKIIRKKKVKEFTVEEEVPYEMPL